MKKFSFRVRTVNLQKFNDDVLDLLIIGGGITGAGVAREASLRGIKVGLVEASDFASGTSSRSSKLIHGGIRYLENKEFKLVFEALSERAKLFEMAPHLVHPLRFMIPLYKNSRVGMFTMSLGMWLYDALSLFQAPELHERLDSKKTSERMPIINKNELVGSFIYSDAYMDDDRLVVETLRSANESGAIIANYVKAIGFKNENGLHLVECIDQISKRIFFVKTKRIISCVGPWTDQLGKEIAISYKENWKNMLRMTKGIHLTLSKDRLPLSSAVVMAAEKSKRIVFGIPRHEMVIIGTTDTDFNDSPENVKVDKADVDYLIKIVNEYFPGAQIKESDIIASYAGVRPLIDDGAETEGKTSREHSIFKDHNGITYVAGGKYTTHRLMAHQVLEKAIENMTVEEKALHQYVDTSVSLNKMTNVENYHLAKSKISEWSEQFKLPLQDVQKLVERFGYEAEEILKLNINHWSYWELEADHAIEHAMCFNLVDFYSRRVPLVLAYDDHGMSLLPKIINVFAQKLNWSEQEIEKQKVELHQYLKSELSWKSS